MLVKHRLMSSYGQQTRKWQLQVSYKYHDFELHFIRPSTSSSIITMRLQNIIFLFAAQETIASHVKWAGYVQNLINS